MNREGFVASTESGLRVGSHQKLYLVRMPKGTNLEVFDGASFDLSKGKSDKLFKDEDSEFHCHLEPASYHELARPLLQRNRGEAGLSVGPPLAGTLTLTRKFVPEPRLDAQVLELYREVEQRQDLRIRTLPFGSTSSLKNLVKANLDTHVRQTLIKKRSIHETSDDASATEPSHNTAANKTATDGTEKAKKRKHK